MKLKSEPYSQRISKAAVEVYPSQHSYCSRMCPFSFHNGVREGPIHNHQPNPPVALDDLGRYTNNRVMAANPALKLNGRKIK